MTTTGSGWVDPGAVDSVEYMTGGDSAAVAMQYSYLPSWMSYLVDQDRAREAGRELFDAVYDRWSKLPLDDRPRLVVVGESLGSFGGETAFSGEYDLRNRTGGAVFAGPPNFNTLYREFVDDRDAGSREVEPEYRDGRTVRFTDDPSAAIPPDRRTVGRLPGALPPAPLRPHRVVEPRSCMYARPDWLEEARGDDVVDAVRWIPFVTFWQVTADLPFATNVPGRARARLHDRVRRRLGPRPPAGGLDRREGRPTPRDPHRRRLTPHCSRWAAAAASVPSELVARWSRIGARRLPLRRRSTVNRTPAAAVPRQATRTTAPTGKAPST